MAKYMWRAALALLVAAGLGRTAKVPPATALYGVPRRAQCLGADRCIEVPQELLGRTVLDRLLELHSTCPEGTVQGGKALKIPPTVLQLKDETELREALQDFIKKKVCLAPVAAVAALADEAATAAGEESYPDQGVFKRALIGTAAGGLGAATALWAGLQYSRHRSKKQAVAAEEEREMSTLSERRRLHTLGGPTPYPQSDVEVVGGDSAEEITVTYADEYTATTSTPQSLESAAGAASHNDNPNQDRTRSSQNAVLQMF